MKQSKTPYLLDSSLLPIVKEYLDAHLNTDVDTITYHLMENYPQFANRNFRFFRANVRKVVDHICTPKKKPSKISEGGSVPKTPMRKTPCRDLEIITVDDDKLQSSASKKKADVLKEDFSEIDLVGEEIHNKKSKEVRSTPLQHNAVSKVTNLTETPTTPTRSTPTRSTKRKTDKDSEAPPIDLTERKRLKNLLFGGQLSLDSTTPSLSDLAGLEYVQKDIDKLLSEMEEKHPVFALVSGVRGAGKTTLVAAIAKEVGLPLTQIYLDKIMRSSVLSVEKKLQDELLDGVLNAPRVLLISQMEGLWNDSNNSRQADKGGIWETLYSFFARLSTQSDPSLKPSRLLVVLECCHPDLMDLRLLNCFYRHIALKPPTAQQRTLILQKVVSRYSVSDRVDLSLIALKCSGFVAEDLVQLVKRAHSIASDRYRSEKQLEGSVTSPTVMIVKDDFSEASKFALPSLKKGFPAIPDKTWDDVGGLQDIREVLRQKICDPIMFPDYTVKLNKKSSGVLLWGPPGCGKTLLAKAVANEAGINLLIVSGPEVLSMYQGESERAIRMIFARAASVSPCVIFFDEFDSICPKRSKTTSDSGSKSTIVNTLLIEMNGFLERPGIYFMAATNLPSVLDTAVLRPGRFDTLLYVGLPGKAARVAVFKAATKNGTLPALASDVNLEEIADLCVNFSGADCHSLVDTASTECWEEMKKWRNSQQSGNEDSNPFTEGEYKLYARHFTAALKKVFPSVSDEELEKYENQQKKFRVAK